MILSTEQVAAKLGVNKKTVYKLRDDGKLTDLVKRKEGAKKHYSKFQSKEVNALIKTIRPVRVRQVDRPSPPPSSASNILVRIEERLISVETSINAMLEMWR